MQLKKIKLAGFKSFVDPTIVLVPSKLVAVVGPNGCGKSNVIDAVCWVMGESSAKYLRGEMLTDVIFNGSSSRKPVGQASVELIFDNQDNTLGGEYSSYAEISIRRVITRTGDSSFFLNGSRCRRRDIIDIFLGTGLGPRSYSIIGQNMIARIIESKPDELRVYLEEAAGVSKYKDRRRETENRIQHTKENLARLNDISSELEKQLVNLKRQANAAEKFKLLKQEERTLKAQWLAIQWRKLDKNLIASALHIQQQETGLEARHAEMSDLNLRLDAKRELQNIAIETFQEVQGRYYAAGNEITRLEQEIRHTQERRQQLETDLKQIEKDYEDTNTNLAETEDELSIQQAEAKDLQPKLQVSLDAFEHATKRVTQAELASDSWQVQWDDFNQAIAQNAQTAQVEQTRIQHLEQKLASLKQRQLALTEEQDQIQISQLENKISALTEQLQKANEQTKSEDKQLLSLSQQMDEAKKIQQDVTQQLDQAKNQLQQLRGRQASLEALQETALGQRNNRTIQWLTKHNLDKYPRLAQSMEVEAGWEYAVEKVLGLNLQALCIEQLPDLANIVEDFKEGNLNLIRTNATEKNISVKSNMLLSKVKSKWPLASLLEGIYIADNYQEALNLCESLAPSESVITKKGVWLSASWLRLSGKENPEAGIFQRKQELKQLTKQINELSQAQNNFESQLVQCLEKLKALEINRGTLQKNVHQSHSYAAELLAQQKIIQQRITDLKNKTEKIQKEKAEQIEQIQHTQNELAKSRSVWQQAMQKWEEQTQQKDNLKSQRDKLQTELHTHREQLNQIKDDIHQNEMRLETTKSQVGSLQQTITRLQKQRNLLEERKSALELEFNAITGVEDLKKSLEVALNRRLQIEEDLHSARSKADTLDQELRSLMAHRQELEHEIAKFRDMLETIRVECQGIKVKSENLLEQINETDLSLEDILKQLPEEANIDEWFLQLEQVRQRINRLGAINLVAIEEYDACAERKEYIDKQNADLQEGLTTLENAIAKIDKETRARFKETFDKVNDYFQKLFPTIFVGGRAYLELTGDNLLDAGVTVMACPPGKRNSTIHLLSGGEKALTAIALVFSIFQLNPAPFCLLDEVDAPLDDANIGRFCQLVENMAEQTQFIFISHNKLAIEMAEHLIGITMHEPGVSRLVSVNVEEAVSLAGA